VSPSARGTSAVLWYPDGSAVKRQRPGVPGVYDDTRQVYLPGVVRS